MAFEQENDGISLSEYELKKSVLISFEEEIAGLFNSGKIRHPVHLESGNEDALINIFNDIRPDDWVCGSWRMHLKCLLKGVPPIKLKEAILRGDSMALCFPEHRIISSPIVGGILPIALGIAMGIKRSGGDEQVHCFLGDMTALTGIAHECMNYGRNLPIRWIIEDNGVSVCTPTAETWPDGIINSVRYSYRSKWPHAGAGVRVQF